MDGLNAIESDILLYVYSKGVCDADRTRDFFYDLYQFPADVDGDFERAVTSSYIRQNGDQLAITETGKRFLHAKQHSRARKLMKFFRVGQYEGVASRVKLGALMFSPSTVVDTARALNYRLRYDISGPDRRKILISPTDVDLRVNRRMFIPKFQRGIVKGGDWDRVTTKFEGYPIYRGLHQRFVEGLPWSETVYYEWAKLSIEATGDAFGCSTPEEFLEHRCSYVERLHESIRQEGYKRQSEAGNVDQKRTNQDVDIGVCIDRDGNFLLYDGHHRMTIAKILSIDTVPVDVLVSHAQWEQKRQATVRTDGEDADNAGIHPDIERYQESC